MPRILSFGEKNSKVFKSGLVKAVWNWYSSQDKFVRFFLVFTAILILVTPAIISSYLIFNPQASGNSVSIEAENMVSIGSVSSGSDSLASSGRFAQLNNGKDISLNQTVFSFYYSWYGNPSKDGSWSHWGQNGHSPPDDIGSNFYPQLGAYSSADISVVAQHMQWIKDAGIGVLIYGWWGQGSREDSLAPLILSEASKQGIKVAWHIEPYSGRDIGSINRDIRYIYDKYGQNPAFFRVARPTKYGNTANPRGVFFVYESSGLAASQWKFLMDVIHSDPIYNSIVIANTNDACYIDGCDSSKESHFDGLYGYNISGGDYNNFGYFKDEADKRNSIFVSSVGPGFDATRATTNPNILPHYNSPGCSGYTYDCQWQKAFAAKSEWVGIVSFNEWHEGSQVEPAIPKSITSYSYRDYDDFDSSATSQFYIEKTKQWSYRKNICSKLSKDDAVLNAYFTIPNEGKYKLWVRVKDEAVNNKFLLKIDGQCGTEVVNKGSAGNWNWIDYAYGVIDNSNAKITYDFTAGTHGIQLAGISFGTKIDKIIFTQDMNCVPVNDGTSCAGQEVTPLPSSVPTATPTLAVLPTDTPQESITPTVPSAQDTIPPTVSITNPKDGQRIARSSSIDISASATDNIGVARVEIYFGASLICNITSSPYFCSHKLPGKPNAVYEISAKAYDVSGNVATFSINIVTQ